VEIRVEPYDGEVGMRLTAALSSEIQERYGPEDFPAADPAIFAPPGGAFVVAYQDGEPAGCGAFQRVDQELAEVHRMFVVMAHRRRGVATAVLSFLEEVASRAGYTRLRLETGTLQPEAIELYRTAGWTEIPCFPPYGAYENSVCFEKGLPTLTIHSRD